MRIILLLAFSLMVFPSLAQAKTQDDRSIWQVIGDTVFGEVADDVFTDEERRIIRDYFDKDEKGDKKAKSKKKSLPPGLAKRDSLPPGLQKQLDENGSLPPGLAKRDLPNDLARQLKKRRGQERIIVGNDVILIEEGTRIVLDILENIVTGD